MLWFNRFPGLQNGVQCQLSTLLWLQPAHEWIWIAFQCHRFWCKFSSVIVVISIALRPLSLFSVILQIGKTCFVRRGRWLGAPITKHKASKLRTKEIAFDGKSWSDKRNLDENRWRQASKTRLSSSLSFFNKLTFSQTEIVFSHPLYVCWIAKILLNVSGIMMNLQHSRRRAIRY